MENFQIGDTVLVTEYDYTFEGEVIGFIQGDLIVKDDCSEDYEVRPSDCTLITRGSGESYESANGGWTEKEINYYY